MLDDLKSKQKKKSVYDYSSNEEEVLAFDDSDDDDSMDDKIYGSGTEDDINDDDDEDEQNDNQNEEDDGLPSSWGSKKSAYYSGNKIENEEDALLEEEEAKAMQAKLMKQLDTDDFGLTAFKVSNKTHLMKTEEELASDKLAASALGDVNEMSGLLDRENLQKIAKNLSTMSKKEKLDFLQRDSPELFELVRDFRLKVSLTSLFVLFN